MAKGDDANCGDKKACAIILVADTGPQQATETDSRHKSVKSSPLKLGAYDVDVVAPVVQEHRRVCRQSATSGPTQLAACWRHKRSNISFSQFLWTFA